MKKEKRYFTNWNYNAARILNDLQTIVENNGGYIAHGETFPGCNYIPFQTVYEIHNRTWMETVRKQEELINRLTEFKKDTKAASEKLEEYKKANVAPIETRFTGYIHFVLDGIYYELSFNDNPFFDFHYCKIKLNSKNEYIGQYYREEFTKEWLYDCLFTFSVPNSDIREIANQILNQLISSKESGEYIETKKTRVPNTYDNGYHYENVRVGNRRKVEVKPC